jgi:hypothetical protein
MAAAAAQNGLICVLAPGAVFSGGLREPAASPSRRISKGYGGVPLVLTAVWLSIRPGIAVSVMRAVLLAARGGLMVIAAVQLGRRLWPASAAGLAVAVALALTGGCAGPVHQSRVRSPVDMTRLKGSFLKGVSCARAGFCMAVGYYPAGTRYQTLTERWDGSSWSRLSSPNPGDTQGNFLSAVSCASATFCMAAGSYSTGGKGRTLTEKWDGTRWNLVSSPNLSANGNFLLGVSCASATFCMAAGAYNSGGHGQPLTEKWDGTRWNAVSSPNPDGIQNSFLGGASCTSARFCMAAGATPDQAVAQTWNGTSWIRLKPASTGRTQPALYGVSCTSPRFCMAAGYQFPGAHDQTVTETWNGIMWSRLSTPSTSSTQHNALYAASCTSTTFCMAVGAYSSNGTSVRPLTAWWNGTRWELALSPNR